ncbi:hypothetical protein FRC04_006950 [Tulasnella sp. 424]|nr:hypothetical protein FRC04_006950 [Tulasnella sp. 424]
MKHLLFVSDAPSDEVGAVAYLDGGNPRWAKLDLDETARASAPLAEDGSPSSIVGMDLDLTSTASIKSDSPDEERTPATPILLTYSSEGTVFAYHILNTDTPNFPHMMPFDPSRVDTAAPSPQPQPTAGTPAANTGGASAAPALLPFGATSASTAKPTFGFGGSLPAFGSTAFGSTTPTVTPNKSAFSQPAFGTSTTPAFGQPAFGASTTPAFGGSAKPAFGAPAFGATTIPPAFGKPAFGQTGFGAAAPQAAAPAFGGFGAATDTEDTAPASPPPPIRYRPSPPIPAGAGAGALGRSGTIGGSSTRSSGLENLHPAYYRLYWKPSTALPSLQPVDSSDPSLSSFYVEHVPPPRKGKNFLAFVCDREQIHITRAKLYVNIIGIAGEEQLRLVNPAESLKRTATSCGATPDNPLLVTIEMPPDGQGVRNREHAALPLPLALRASRAMGKAIVGLVKKKNTGDTEVEATWTTSSTIQPPNERLVKKHQ